MKNPFSLSGKTILVTGASSGIGRATAVLCSEMGARLILTGRNETELNITLTMLSGNENLVFPLDLSAEETWTDFLLNSPDIDGIANCAGVANMNPFPFINKDELNHVFDVNFFGPILLIKSLVKNKKISRNSSIVLVSSVDGPKVVHAGNSVYSSSKSALVGMAKSMAVDLAAKKIRVNCVLPGTTDTPMIRTGNVTEEDLVQNAKLFPLKRLGTPEDMANAIVFLLSEASSFITGTELIVDGGYSLQ